ncbi:hypothetical protein PV327_009672 [Microctonus hyperodae]|uniref:RGS domain-containing protein n=1 Tax=Microctonus hyperodae TaxID=165561 RepID=A0AA39CBK1_MICHY|nr:hypothetical protein PV327_009672 [Microctonus hyperodae]KAK0161173.1 hypothetical protein PV327_009672 [Microctonus hyperodae]
MIEMSSGIGASAMGIGVSHGSGGEGVANSCRLRAQGQQQNAGNSQQQINPQQSQTDQQISQNNESPQKELQQIQQQQQQQQSQQQTQRSIGNPGHGGRSKKDNCCLCWCCCCSCSLAAVGSGNGAGSGVGGDSGKKRGLGGIGGGDIGSGGGHPGDLVGSGAENGLDSYDGLDSTPECCGLDEVRSWGSSFDKLMRSAAGRKLFREFLISEYSEENIAFWLACEQLKRENNPEKIEEKARYIYEDYISILSPKEVSLDSRVREIVNRNMVEPTPHTFDEAQLQIYTLMHRDSYPRFVNSDIYRRVARLGSGPPSPTIEDHAVSVAKNKSKKSIT